MRKYLLAIVGLVLLCLLAALGTASGSPSTFTVNTTDDTDDLTCDTSHCSLREAINAANSDPGSTIEFSIPATDTGHEVSGITGTWTIPLTSSLPILSGGGTIISGTTQGDLNPDGPEIEISGASMGSGPCLDIRSAGNVVHGLVINRCHASGVRINLAGANTNTVSGNYIGTDASGSTKLGNGSIGVEIRNGAQGNVVGGDIPEERNVISGNVQYGVTIYGSGTMSNTVSGNYIGTDVTGAQGLGNGDHGVAIWAGAQNNTVGGDTEGERNIISDNGIDGVNIQDSGTTNNTISGNFIGTDVTGTQDKGNASRGVRIVSAPNNTIGGDNTAGERNVISGNDVGVTIGSAAMSNTVSGNYIGTDVTGAEDLGNAFYGVQISGGAQNNTVGGDTSGERNVISGNNFYGVDIYWGGTDGNTVSGNYIGTDATGTQELGNTYDGVLIEDGPQNNTVGGQTAGERNVISGNGWSGVHIKGAGTDGNTVSLNYIGTDVTGTQDKGNGYDGVTIDAGAQDNTVGGQTAGQRNVISGNSWSGVHIKGAGTDGNTVSQNYIGTDVTGTQELGNGWDGIRIDDGAQNNTVGGQTEGERNIISGNESEGVVIEGTGTMSNTVSGNFIGTVVTGTEKLGNTSFGVAIQGGARNNTVGGDTEGERNVISGNSVGVSMSGSGTMSNTISGNYIGTDVTGTQDKGNTFDGVTIDAGAKNNTIGPDNLIALNSSDGVEVRGSNTLTNTITRNSIHSNGLLGIDNIDEGNTELPPPAISGGSCVAITGTAPLSATVELFTSPDDEGKTYLTTVSADGSGNWSASGFLADDAYLTATATDAAGNTSEFSAVAGCGRHTYVDSTTDVLDAAVLCNLVGIGDLPGPDKETSLREAICAANNNAGSPTIAFSIPVTDTGYEVSGITGTWTISLTSLLPTLTAGGTIISGTTQAANQGDLNLDGPEIEITGAGVGSGNCLQVASASNVIHGLVINRCQYSGVALMGSGATTNTVSGNYIGTDATGTQDKGNGHDGVRIDAGAKNNTVGPDNLIALNTYDGVEVRGTNTLTNTITRNSIHSNGLLGIDNIDGGNTELPPPAISGPSCVAITGTAPPSATVEIFTGPDEEGKTYLATCSADGAGNWSVTGAFTLDAYVTATATDPSGNTSEFSTAGACYRVFVPLTVKNY